MLISWINRFSLIEYPGQISCVIFTPGCNMRCPFCHNAEFVLPEKLNEIMGSLIPEKALFNFLKERKLNLTGISICWWEPTLQKDLKEFCRKVKDMGYNIKLDTNWRDYVVLKELIEEWLVDYIAMDIKHEPWKFNDIVWVKVNEEDYYKSIRLIIDSGIEHEFRTTVIKWIHNEDTIENIAKYIVWAKNYYIQNYRKEKTLDSNFKWEKFSSKELENLYKAWKKYIKSMWIRE